MSIRYGATNSDRLSIAAATSINDLKAWTNIGWYRASSFASGGLRMWAKQSSSLQRHAGAIANSSGALAHDAQRATTDGAATSSTPLILEVWHCVAFTYDETDGPRIFLGTHDRVVSEVLYASRAVGTGGTEVDAAAPLYFANRDTHASAFIGQIQEQAHFARRMDLHEIQRWADEPYPEGAAVFILHGQNLVGVQTDLSGNGNHGTVVGPALHSFDRPALAEVKRRRWWASVAAPGGVIVNPMTGRGGGAAWPLAA